MSEDTYELDAMVLDDRPTEENNENLTQPDLPFDHLRIRGEVCGSMANIFGYFTRKLDFYPHINWILLEAVNNNILKISIVLDLLFNRLV
jgi:hypothetical protein